MSYCDYFFCSIQECQADVTCNSGLAFAFGIIGTIVIIGITILVHKKKKELA